ncbi:hypothetical protein JTB14_001119 [Gonioctena quinquepunctata]|nr:hypothetical protein JTB14_001119 [Gonioctena quinquepunctata]
MEHELQNAMLDEDMEKSHSENSMVSVQNIDIPIEGNEVNETVKNWINNIPEDIPEEVENEPENKDIKLLCETLSNVLNPGSHGESAEEKVEIVCTMHHESK